MHYLRVSIFGAIAALMLVVPNAFATIADNTLSGTITDKSTHTALPGATVYLPDLHTGASADAQGHFSIKHLPKGRYLVEVHYIGYAAFTETVQIDGATTLDISLSET